jgi:hypothetical protein
MNEAWFDRLLWLLGVRLGSPPFEIGGWEIVLWLTRNRGRGHFKGRKLSQQCRRIEWTERGAPHDCASHRANLASQKAFAWQARL